MVTVPEATALSMVLQLEWEQELEDTVTAPQAMALTLVQVLLGGGEGTGQVLVSARKPLVWESELGSLEGLP